jgi:hypothetical protein
MNTYHISKRDIPRKGTEERNFDFSTLMATHTVAFEGFVQALKEERPDIVYRAVVVDLVENMSDIMKIWLYFLWV